MGHVAAASVKTPALDKRAAQRTLLGIVEIEQFLDWFLDEERRGALCESLPPGYYPIRQSIDQLLAEYMGIDLADCEREREAILDALRREGP